jgi:hypothetical protein
MASLAPVFFTRSNELSQTRFIPLILDAVVDLGGTPTRPEIIERAIELGRFTPEELAVPSHTRQDREMGRGAVAGRLRYAIWQARTNGALLSGDTGGRQVLTDKGRAMIGAPTGYPELDARRLAPGGAPREDLADATLRPYVPPRRGRAKARSLGDALPRSGSYDIDELDRRTVEHHTLQMAAARWISELGWDPGLSPAGSEILADLIAEHDGRWVVVEVKTLDEARPDLARQQLRLGLGQVLDYRERLRQANPDTHPVIVVSAAPRDPLWMGIMNACGVGLAWPPFDAVPVQLVATP